MEPLVKIWLNGEDISGKVSVHRTPFWRRGARVW